MTLKLKLLSSTLSLTTIGCGEKKSFRNLTHLLKFSRRIITKKITSSPRADETQLQGRTKFRIYRSVHFLRWKTSESYLCIDKTTTSLEFPDTSRTRKRRCLSHHHPQTGSYPSCVFLLLVITGPVPRCSQDVIVEIVRDPKPPHPPPR